MNNAHRTTTGLLAIIAVLLVLDVLVRSSNAEHSGPTGACCIPSGACNELTEADCVAQGGIYYGDGVTSCPPTSPCEIFGACCNPNTGTCGIHNQLDCNEPSQWKGAGTDCSDADFNGNPDVCENSCPPDLSGDGFVDITDLFLMFAQWGQCP